MTTAAREDTEGWFTRERVLVLVLAAVTAIVFYLCYRLVAPFIPALTWALALAVVAHPLHEWLQRRIPNKSLVAAVSVAIVTVAILAPAVLVVHQVTTDAVASADKLREFLTEGHWRTLAERSELAAVMSEWVERHVNVSAQLQRFSENILGSAKKVISGSFHLVAGILITLFLLFYFFRDKERMLLSLRRFFPLSPRESERMFGNVRDTIYAIVYGSVLVALVQGALGGIMFWILGLPEPLLWAAMMSFFAMLPVLGTAIVWIPAAVYLLLTGHWEKALILTAWGGIVVALIDNLLYPLLVKGRLRMHTVPVFMAVLGGLFSFGPAGIVLGPLVLAIAVVLADIWRRRMAYGNAVENGVDAEKAATVGTAPAPVHDKAGSG